jgi:DNA-binding LytR/AlgR family response regulator
MASRISSLKCIAVDDEPFALKLIADDIEKIPFLQLLKTFSSPIGALEFLKVNRVDLLFLDIQMPVVKGTEFLRVLENPPLVIITTAYDQYALEGFELNVLDYLVKPIPFERFLKAVNKAHGQHQLLTAKASMAKQTFFFVHSEYKEVKIYHDQIKYIEGLKDYVKIFLTTQDRPILTRLNLKGIESKLIPDQFSRVHNSYIVSLSKITSIQKSQLYIDKLCIPIGEKFAPGFERKYGSTV